jgi:hypothetical protein
LPAQIGSVSEEITVGCNFKPTVISQLTQPVKPRPGSINLNNIVGWFFKLAVLWMNHTASLAFEWQCIFPFTIGLGEPAVMCTPHHCWYDTAGSKSALKGDFESAVL